MYSVYRSTRSPPQHKDKATIMVKNGRDKSYFVPSWFLYLICLWIRVYGILIVLLCVYFWKLWKLNENNMVGFFDHFSFPVFYKHIKFLPYTWYFILGSPIIHHSRYHTTPVSSIVDFVVGLLNVLPLLYFWHFMDLMVMCW